MIRYIISLFISIVIYIGLIYIYIYLSRSIEKPKKREVRVKISILEPKKRLIKPTPTPTPKLTPPPIVIPPKPKPKPKKIVHKVKKIAHKPKKIYTPEPIIEEEIYREPEIVTPKQQNSKILDTTPIKSIKEDNRIDDLAIQKRKFLKRVRSNIYSNRIYPLKAKMRGIEGRVHLLFDITSDGEAVNIRTLNAPRILQQSVKKALRRSFPIDIPPILLDKFPMRNISIDIEFRLE